jgi:C1A family cysteine protease
MLKTILATSLLLLVAANSKAEFEEWKIKYSKTYANEVEDAKRLAVFLENAVKVQIHNAKKLSWTMGLNDFADLTSVEFGQRLGLRPGFQPNAEVHQPSGLKIPDTVDWRLNASVVGPVKNQGSCGSCWAFSTIASMEGQIGMKTGSYTSLSEQNLVDCVKNEPTPYDNSTCCDGCQGGLMDNGFNYVVQHQAGVVDTEASYPYKGRNEKCAFNPATKGPAAITGFKDCRAPNPDPATAADEDNVKDALATVGPISIAVDAALGWQLYFGGIHSCSKSGEKPTKADHGVALVGYGTDNGKAYWTIRNSWGASWGEKGYIRVPYGTNECGLANFASYPTA